MNLIETIDRWAELYPERAAHISGARFITYEELRTASDGMAAHLRRAHLKRDRPVAIVGHKQSEMLTGFIGSIKAGHPYIPVDSSTPHERISKIVETAGATLYTVDQVVSSRSDAETERGGLPEAVGQDELWYIIFTSGSTGDPKGVMITRGCLESFVSWTLEEQNFREAAEVFLNQAPFSFDLSVMDLYCSLATGGTLFSLTQEEISTPRRLFNALTQSGVTIWVSTPSFARMCLMEPTFGRAMMPDVRKFWFCGETLPHEVAAQLLHRFPGSEVWNTYGPTEATVATTSIRIGDEILAQHDPLPVGRVKPRTRIVIQDVQGNPASAGTRGEIIIAGPNVSVGYVRRPDLTEKAFFELDGERAYRTGDAGRVVDGVLFFEGRMDFQIKLHGYRIELEDVEANIRRLDAVRDAVVLPVMRAGHPEYLVAFAILAQAQNGSDFEVSQRLRQSLAARLPEYMVPRAFRFLEAFPITRNGKVDRKQLAETLP